jgi:hypothetical protein
MLTSRAIWPNRLPWSDPEKSISKDIMTGPCIRIHKKSVVVPEKSPFNQKFSKMEVIMEEKKGENYS